MSIDRAKAQKAAQKYLAKGQIDRAISEYEKVVGSDPSDARSLLKLGDLYTRQGDNRGASTAYRKVAAQYAAQGFFLKAVAVYKQILKLDPNDLAAIEALADMYEKLSLASDALAAYEQVADAHARAGKPEKGLSALGRMAELDKENVAAWIRYAEALSKADRIDEASNAFRRGADLLKQQGRMEDFIKVTERLLFHSHEDLDRARELAGIYIARGQPKSALAHLQTCFKVDPRDVATLELLARAFAALEQTPKAISVYRELARVHAEAERSTEEADALRALLELAPHDAETARRLQVLEAVSAPEDAVELIDDDGGDDVVIVDDEEPTRPATSSASSMPPNPDLEREAQIARLMAECEVFLRYGLRDKVIAQLGRVLDLDPAHLDAREKLKTELLKRGDRAQAVVQLLALATHAGDPGRARGYLEEAAAIEPGNAEVAARLRAQPAGIAQAAPDDDVIMVDDEQDESDFSDLRSRPPAAPPPRPAAPPPAARLAGTRPGVPLPPPAFGTPRAISAPLSRDETDFSDLRSIAPKPAARLSAIAPPPPASAPGGFRDGPTAEIEFVDEAASEAPLELEPAPMIGPRDISLATALEGPGDDEPELLLEDGSGLIHELEAEAEEAEDTGEYDRDTETDLEPEPAAAEEEQVWTSEATHPGSPSGWGDDPAPLSPQVPSARPQGVLHAIEHAPLPQPVRFIAPAPAYSPQPLVLDEEPEPELTYGSEPPSGLSSLPPVYDRFIPPDPEPAPEPEPEPESLEAEPEPESFEAEPEAEAEPEELPEEVSDALEEADFYLAQHLFDEAREVLIEAMYEYPSDPALRAKLAEIDTLESNGAAAPSSPPAAANDAAELGRESQPVDQSFALAQKLMGDASAPAQGPGPVAIEHVLQQFRAGVERQVDPGDTATHYDLGIAYMEMGLHAEAIEEFKLCLTNDGRLCTAHTMIGLSYVAKGDMPPALEHFIAALNSPGRTPDEEITLWFEIGNAYELLGRASEALVYYEKVEELNPGFRDVAARIERLGVTKSAKEEVDEFDTMFENMIVKD